MSNSIRRWSSQMKFRRIFQSVDRVVESWNCDATRKARVLLSACENKQLSVWA